MNCDIVVHLDAGPRTAARLDVAVDLATRRGARLVGLFGQTESSPGMMASRDRSRALVEAAAPVRETFEARAAAAGIAHVWRDVSGWSQDRLVDDLVAACRLADLVVLGQYDAKQAAGTLPEEMNEQVVLNCGRPVLLIPSVGDYAHVGRNVVVAWNGSREAARALADAMPALEQADHVTVLGVRPAGTPDTLGEEAVVEHLACHGVKASWESLGVADIGVMDAILSRSADLGADLLVMGAHGHYGFPATRRGGNTRYVLRHMPLPVVMSH